MESKHHFFNLGSRMIRQMLCDYARQRLAQAHDETRAATGLDRELHQEARALIELDAMLMRLESAAPRLARVFECRYFAGLSAQETADALGISLLTAHAEWDLARQRLQQLAGPTASRT